MEGWKLSSAARNGGMCPCRFSFLPASPPSHSLCARCTASCFLTTSRSTFTGTQACALHLLVCTDHSFFFTACMQAIHTHVTCMYRCDLSVTCTYTCNLPDTSVSASTPCLLLVGAALIRCQPSVIDLQSWLSICASPDAWHPATHHS